MLLGELVGREAHPEPGSARPPREVPHPAPPGQPRPLGQRLPLGGRGGHRRPASSPRDAFFVERREYGPLIGTPVLVKQGEKTLAEGPDGGPEAPARPPRPSPRRPQRRLEDREGRDRRHQLSRSRRPAWRAGELDLVARQNPGRDLATERAEVEKTDRRGEGQVPGQDRGAAEAHGGARARPTSPSAPPTARRRSSAPSTSTAPTPPTSSPGSAGWASTAGGSGSSSATTPASRTPRAASSPPSSAP